MSSKDRSTSEPAGGPGTSTVCGWHIWRTNLAQMFKFELRISDEKRSKTSRTFVAFVLWV